MGRLSTTTLPLAPHCEASQLPLSSLQKLLTSPPIHSSTNINNILSDNLLVEILQRLPFHFALRAKSVCKHWFLLISNTYFIQSFTHHHDQHCRVMHYSLPFTLVYEFNYWHHHLTETLHCKVHAISEHRVFQSCGFHLDFLPCFWPWESQPIQVVAAFKDILVCCNPRLTFQRVYYICNPLTRQWLALPPARSYHKVADTAIGFITCLNVGSQNSYKLVRVPQLDLNPDNNQLEIEVFSSQTGAWINKVAVFSSSRSFKRTWQFKPDAITFENKLHWLVNSENIVVFDPYEDNEESCKVIDLPFGLNSSMAICLGSCQEYLTVSQLVGRCLNPVLVIWKLRDYGTCQSNWHLQCKINLKEMVFVDNQCFHSFKYLTAEVLAFHPSEGEILYLRFDNKIVMCDLGRMKLELLSECLGDSSFSIGTRGVFCSCIHVGHHSFLLLAAPNAKIIRCFEPLVSISHKFKT